MKRTPGLTLRQLLEITPTSIKTRAATQVLVLTASKGKTEDGRGIVIAKTKSKTPTVTAVPREHVTVIESLDGYKISESGAHVKVSCDCGFFTFVCEYALTKYGASTIKYCNGQPPNITNPEERPFLCKHLAILGLALLRRNM